MRILSAVSFRAATSWSFSSGVNDWIERETALARKMMQENPAFAKNMEELAKKLGIKQGGYMTFHEANELRGNPNYAKSSAYRVNCQTCVVAHELRRRGFNVEALANTKGSKLEKLSYRTNEIWVDANGNIPEKTIIGAEKNAKGRWEKTVPNRRQLLKKLEGAITEDGRYHVDWYWSSENKGHIITLEKVGNTLRFYDPQNGKIISNFYDYIDDIRLSHGIRLLRVDNLRINAEYASQILGKSGTKAFGGVIGKGGISGKVSYKEQDEVLKSDRFKIHEDNTPYSNLKSGFLKRQGKSRKFLLKHCYKSESIEAAEYIWGHPEELKFKRRSELGENKDMSLQKNINNIESKKKRGIQYYNEYTFKYKGKEWQIGMEVHKKGFEQMYYIK